MEESLMFGHHWVEKGKNWFAFPVEMSDLVFENVVDYEIMTFELIETPKWLTFWTSPEDIDRLLDSELTIVESKPVLDLDEYHQDNKLRVEKIQASMEQLAGEQWGGKIEEKDRDYSNADKLAKDALRKMVQANEAELKKKGLID
jgi:hypothetical protein